MKTTQPLVLEASGLTKSFGHGKGVFGIDLAIAKGEIVGFVGPNGAGKSTTINLLAGFVKPDSGSFQLLGEAVDYRTIYRLMPRLGIMFSEPTIEEELTAEQLFERSDELLGHNSRVGWHGLARQLELDTGRRIKKLSLGNKKKVGVVLALMHRPELVIMDEPTSGLDPLIRGRFMEILRELAAKGTTVLLSSHDLSEVQQICHTIVMIKAGKVIRQGETAALLESAARTFRLVAPSDRLQKAVAAKASGSLRHEGNEIVFETKHYDSVIKLLAAADFYNFYVERPSLENTFKEIYQ